MIYDRVELKNASMKIVEETIFKGEKATLRYLVDMAVSSLQSFYAEEQSGEMTRGQAWTVKI